MIKSWFSIPYLFIAYNLINKSLLLKRKAVSGVTLLDFDFALKQNTKLPTNATNKSKNHSFYRLFVWCCQTYATVQKSSSSFTNESTPYRPARTKCKIRNRNKPEGISVFLPWSPTYERREKTTSPSQSVVWWPDQTTWLPSSLHLRPIAPALLQQSSPGVAALL
jgi:hypothetical protein